MEKKNNLEERRSFIVLCLKGLAAVGAGGFLYSMFNYLSRGELDIELTESGPRVLKAGLTSGGGSGGANQAAGGPVEISAGSFPPGGSRIVAVDNVPVIIVSRDEGYSAFDATCSHLGCLVQWDSELNKFVCPCHAGTYDRNGRVLAGPPPRDLAKCNVAVNGDKLTITLV